MGSISGRKLNKVLDNLEYILAIRITHSCQAIVIPKTVEK
jgi:histidine ammonia-lyase